jgi:hypothetical protein
MSQERAVIRPAEVADLSEVETVARATCWVAYGTVHVPAATCYMCGLDVRRVLSRLSERTECLPPRTYLVRIPP